MGGRVKKSLRGRKREELNRSVSLHTLALSFFLKGLS